MEAHSFSIQMLPRQKDNNKITQYANLGRFLKIHTYCQKVYRINSKKHIEGIINLILQGQDVQRIIVHRKVMEALKPEAMQTHIFAYGFMFT